MPNRDYHQERRDYDFKQLSREALSLDPFIQFSHWMDEAVEEKIIDPTAMSIATVDSKGQPHSRVVLLKEIDENGFVFYSHYDSAKGQQIENNPHASLLFFWPQMDRQIRIEGLLEKVSREQSEAYFHSRPRDSQLAAASSSQSMIVPGRKTLEMNYEIQKAEHEHLEVPCPEHWGGYRLVPNRFEFWQGRPNRLHDRFIFILEEKHSDSNHQAWLIERLAP
ncbi:pyridoxamine 5'-phosphate oxidase [Thiomicrorhabdus sp. Kp2]|uniref:pyridoxamine 5'-phosphate oxidase n=1 Tax=Thiomicrorhabdus sp. Kp2 TaxID=1123518 RepID=UPI00041EA85F|nr:pyridoxamine 5'-phosphate oxidase [Thiomicrorhabdus sp. Kp2]